MRLPTSREHVIEITVRTDRSIADTAKTAADMARLVDLDDEGVLLSVNVLTYDDDGGWDEEQVHPVPTVGADMP